MVPPKVISFSGIYMLDCKTEIPAPIEKVWDFFSRAENLDAITPPKMGFEITSGKTEKTFAGQIISYRIQIFPFLKTFWITEITHMKTGEYFIDEQRFGPYAMWHHEHHFCKTEKGTEMRDRVHYKLPFGFLGRLLAGKIIARRVQEIFKYRNEKIAEFF